MRSRPKEDRLKEEESAGEACAAQLIIRLRDGSQVQVQP